MPEIIKLSKSYGDTVVYSNFNLSLKKNSINVLLGPSGCGKSTLLDIISGLKRADSGELKGIDRKRISYLFQEPRLLPWKTVLENITYILREPKAKSREIALSLLNEVGLGDSRDKYPGELSGGMARRAAIARTFAYDSSLIILDEPFASLDSQLKVKLIDLFKRVWQDDKRTVLCVTHDREAADILDDRIVILSDKPVKIVESIDLPDSGKN